MPKILLTFLVSFLIPAAHALPIKHIELLNPVLSAGGKFDLRFETDGATRIDPIGGVTVWLGTFPHLQIFKNSDGANRESRLLAGNVHQVTNLSVNPWVVPRLNPYSMVQIIFFESSKVSHMYSAGSDGHPRC